jgi:hypothetical protein
MKKLILVAIGLASTLSVFSSGAFAQEENAKNLYLAHASDSKRGRPGVKLTIELKRGGLTRKVPMSYVFRAGDKVKFHFETNFNAYVKVINIGSTGALQLLYPYRDALEFASKGSDYAIPNGDFWFEFDQNPGAERLTFVFSSRPLPVETQSRAALTPDSAQSGSDDQKALAELSSQSMENGKDFKLVHDSQENDACAYGVAMLQTLRSPIGVSINLRHR